MFKYFWSKSEETYLNNRYYQSLTGKATHALNCIKDNSGKLTHVKVGGVDGSAAQVSSCNDQITNELNSKSIIDHQVTWKAAGKGYTVGGGPYSWRKNLDVCFDGGIGTSGVDRLLKSGNFSSEADIYANCWDFASQSTSNPFEWTCSQDCYTEIDFVDEVALNVDMGLYLDFQTDKKKAGLQSGCPGMELVENANQGGKEVFCNLGPFAHFVQQYADDQALWVQDFGAAYTKMLDNVYDDLGNKVGLTNGKVLNYCDSNYQLKGKKVKKGLCSNTL